MYFKFIPQIEGLVKAPPNRIIPDTRVPEATNVVIRDGRVSRRPGESRVGTNLPLSGAVMAFEWLQLLGSVSRNLIAFTPLDGYKYISASGLWNYITPVFNAGTVNRNATTTKADLTGDVWDTAWPASQYYIKFGTNDANTLSITKTGTLTTGNAVIPDMSNVTDLYVGQAVSGTGIPTGTTIASIDGAKKITLSAVATADGAITITFTTSDWYLITAWDSTTLLTSDEVLPEISSSYKVKYVIRQCFSGDEDYIWDTALPILSAGDRVVVATNGIDAIQKWTGTGNLADLGGTPNLAKFVEFFGAVAAEQLLLLWTVDTGTNQPQTIEMSAFGDPENYTNGYWNDLFRTNDELCGARALQNAIAVYKKESISVAYATGDSVTPLQVKENVVLVGTPSIRTVVDTGQYHIFFGWNNVYVFDGLQHRAIGDEVAASIVAEINNAQIHQCFALADYENTLYCLFIPTGGDYCDKAYVYDWSRRTWAEWSFPIEFTAAGFFYKDSALTCAQYEALGETCQDWLDAGITCDDMLGQADKKTLILGDKDGYVYSFNGGTDDGTEIASVLTTRDFALTDEIDGLQAQNAFHKLLKFIAGMTPSTATMQVRVSVDHGLSWSDWINLNPVTTADYAEVVARFTRRGKQARIQIRNVNGAYFEIENMRVGFVPAGLQ